MNNTTDEHRAVISSGLVRPWAEHRRNNTDPTQQTVDAILDTLNRQNAERARQHLTSQQ